MPVICSLVQFLGTSIGFGDRAGVLYCSDGRRNLNPSTVRTAKPGASETQRSVRWVFTRLLLNQAIKLGSHFRIEGFESLVLGHGRIAVVGCNVSEGQIEMAGGKLGS